MDYASNLASAVSDLIQGNGYESIIQVGIDTIKKIFDAANTKYKEDWLTKIIAIDYISENESQLAAMLDKKYLTFDKLMDWHVIYAYLNTIAKALETIQINDYSRILEILEFYSTCGIADKVINAPYIRDKVAQICILNCTTPEPAKEEPKEGEPKPLEETK